MGEPKTYQQNAEVARKRSVWRRAGRIALFGVGTVIGVAVLVVLGVVTFLWLDEPTPVNELLSAEAGIDLDSYDGSMPADGGSPEILILGTAHFAQQDHGFSDEEFNRVASALAEFQPDMVAVEQLPPDWEPGRGRDYRPEFDLESFSQRWDLTRDEARTRIDEARSAGVDDPCALGRAYFLLRDYANAHYLWDRGGCSELSGSEGIREWAGPRSEGEQARIAFPVAEANGVDELVSFDYQGEDAEWFIYQKAPEFLLRGRLSDLWGVLPEVNVRTRELSGHVERHDDQLTRLLHHLNSPERVGLQYWAYEESMPEIETDNAGERQTENYWLRNEHMFANIDEAVQDEEPARILVVVGAGHKYFLDELARDAGYRWVDPREWLPTPE